MLDRKLRDLRTKQGITQAALAASIGVTPRAVKYWEHGVKTPRASSLLDLARFFHVSLEYLMTED